MRVHYSLSHARRRSSSRLALIGLLVTLGLLLTPPAALADAPGTRGPHAAGQGSTGTTARGTDNKGTSSLTSDATRWQGVQELPPPSYDLRSASVPGLAPMRQSGGENGPIAWLGRNLNPGNWILDAGMGIFAGIVKMFGGIMQKAVLRDGLRICAG